MGLLRIDEKKCKKDGICVDECPSMIIRLKDRDGFPEIVPNPKSDCLVCGHCVAVCPQGALSHENVPIESCPPIKKELKITGDQAFQFLRSRRSARVFKDKPVEKEKIQQVIEIARYAPTGSNSQMVTWTVLMNKDQIREMSKLTIDWLRDLIKSAPPDTDLWYLPEVVEGWDAGQDSVLRDAPAVIIASAPREANSGMTDLTIALTYLDLALLPLGLQGCWGGLLQFALRQSQPLKDLVQLPSGHSNHYPIMLGYPKYTYHRLPERKKPEILWR
ncbi:nitroreductase family protein [Thermodesulfobacteriota bacterium]